MRSEAIRDISAGEKTVCSHHDRGKSKYGPIEPSVLSHGIVFVMSLGRCGTTSFLKSSSPALDDNLHTESRIHHDAQRASGLEAERIALRMAIDTSLEWVWMWSSIIKVTAATSAGVEGQVRISCSNVLTIESFIIINKVHWNN
jgi:hypothetical protein